MFSDFIQHQTQVLGMILLVLGKDQNVIEVDQDEVICVGVDIMRENVGRALTSPKDMTVYSYEP